MDEVVISYETLYELLRREKNREAIQKLPDGFMKNLNSYTRSLKKNLNGKKREITSFDGGVIQQHEKQLDSLVKVIQELYSRREKKILNMALIKSRTKAQLVDVGNMLDEEKALFDSLVSSMDSNRDIILNRMLGHDTPAGSGAVSARQPGGNDKKTSSGGPADPGIAGCSKAGKVFGTDTGRLAGSDDSADKAAHSDVAMSENIIVRICHPIPRFYDREMNVLGPFEEDEIATLPGDIADILIKKGRAEKISS